MLILSDVHGCYDTMLALIAKAKAKYPTDEIICCGDLIDRGKDSAKVVQYMIDNKIKCVRGNHEQMMTDYDVSPEHYNNWLGNGGTRALQSYGIEYDNDPLDDPTFAAHHAWMKTLPFFIEFKDQLSADGRYLVISHSSVGPVWLVRQETDTRTRERFEEYLLWNRQKVTDNSGIFNVFGHTPQPTAKLTEFYANIDSGAVFKQIDGLGRYGHMTCLHFPSMETFTQENIE